MVRSYQQITKVEGVARDTLRVTCLNCGNPVVLFFNGGELDRKECCGYVYRTEAARIDLLIDKELTPSGAD